MNIALVWILFIIGLTGTALELLGKRSSLLLQLLYIVSFTLCAISRILSVDATKDTPDLAAYLKYYLTYDNAYFEKGYVAFCNIVRWIAGTNSIALVFSSTIWIILFFALTVSILNKQYFSAALEKTINEKRAKQIFILPKNHVNYFSTMLFLFCAYWGICYSAEIIRQGMSNVLLSLALAFILNNQWLFSFFSFLIALNFHRSSIMFFPALLLILVLKKYPSRKSFYVWFAILLCADIIIQNTALLDIEFFVKILGCFQGNPYVSRFFEYINTDAGNYFTTQYITYHFFALLMLQGDFETGNRKKIALIYYMGLTFGTLLQKSVIYMRIQWVYLPVVILALYYYIKDDRTQSDRVKFGIATAYSALQTVMAVRYLGGYII